MLGPFDDYPIHPSADPVGTPASGNPNHYDRYWFNGTHRGGDFYLGATMGHYPVRGVVDAGFSLVRDGVEHSIFASGRMPLDRSTVVGPFRVEVVRPIHTIRFIVEPNEHGIECDLTFRATTVAVEEPRQTTRTPEGIPSMDHTRLTQWGEWEGVVVVDGQETRVDPALVPGCRDRSWGFRPVGSRLETNWPERPPQAFWLWAPLHFDGQFTHLALHEHADGARWLETSMILDPMPDGTDPWSTTGITECTNLRYALDWEPGRREIQRADFWFDQPG